jgi:hypothetical protein
MQNANSNITHTNNMYLTTGIHLSTFVIKKREGEREREINIRYNLQGNQEL